ncbi:MAG: YciI family protein [Rhizobiaceae bacterium]
MRFVCLIYHDQAALASRSEAEEQALTAECLAYDDDLRASGKLVLAHALNPPASAKKVRYQRKVQITDGPFIESKEQLIGLVVIDARDEAEALEIAGRSPLARTGMIEVRGAFDIAWNS